MKVAVGIPSYREADNIAQVVRHVDEGLATMAAVSQAVIVNMDSESDDDTVARFLATPTRSPKVSIVAKGAPAGKGRNIRELFAYSADHAIGAIAMIDADVRTTTPAWAPALLEPVIAGRAHYVAPHYLRSRFRGTATNHLAYPIVYGWFGADMHQPIGGDFGLSGSFAEHLLSVPWPESAHGYGIDIFMSGHAAIAGVPWTEAPLGEKVDRFGRTRWVQVASEVIATGLAVIRRSGMAPGPLAPPSWRATPTSEPERPDEESVRRRCDEMRAFTRDFASAYARWVDDASWDPEIVLASPEPRIPMEIWVRLLAGAVLEAATSRESAMAALAAPLVPALWMRTLAFWRDVEGRGPEEVDREVRDQAILFRQTLVARAPAGGHAGKPSSL